MLLENCGEMAGDVVTPPSVPPTGIVTWSDGTEASASLLEEIAKSPMVVIATSTRARQPDQSRPRASFDLDMQLRSNTRATYVLANRSASRPAPLTLKHPATTQQPRSPCPVGGARL